MLAFIYGALWMMMIGVQVKMLSGNANIAILSGWTFGASVIWCLLVRKITIDSKNMWFYSAGTVIGVIGAYYIGR